MAEQPDFAADGLLDDVEGPARVAREQLLHDLLNDGCTIDELRSAVEQDRLALLPAERLLRSEERYTLSDVASEVGLPEEEVSEALSALGLPPAPSIGVRCYGDAELELARLHRIGVDAGVPTAAISELNRVIARGVSQIAAAARTTLIEATLRQGMTEREAGLMWAQAARVLAPNTNRVITLAHDAHLRRLVAGEYIGAADIVAGKTPGAREVTIAFADLVGFTRLGQRIAPEELGRVATELERATARLIAPPVTLVKTIGDAVMLASPVPGPLLDALLALPGAVRSLGPEFPQVRAGVAAGAALERAGDWYGDVVNLASRITGAAPPDGVIVTEAVRRSVPSGYEWTDAGSPPLKGVEEPPPLFLVTAFSQSRS